jgi:mono/diheme cytochrome c family protein
VKTATHFLLAALVAGSLARGAEPPARPSRLTQVPASAQSRANPLAGSADAVRAGEKLFARSCASCHGAAGEGALRGPSLRKAGVRLAAPGALYWVVTNGAVRTGMPPWSNLPEPRRWQVVSYVRSLGPLE